ncbi:MAG TPA: hypothetical protein PLR32_01630 [candidate division Zixibacteria bacterium]|nr:hypothetical protein [candidate division Zixibacteria bacterium]MDD4917007.1 hypothetical protein [candidate division Zixibacteria bacterium]MDM7972602.1 hypothetical protein [candidate division Zixibacteria bacterium]HOD66160.1 hypothetical protein [candidate division Zixibacteria bacterium]HPC11212.1 hypothetical protein [candidate division Zixibacteria bacterium]
MKGRSFVLAALLVAFRPAVSPAAEPFSTRPAIETLEEYFDLLVSGNLASAEGFWTQAAIERSGRFDITFTDIPLKIDAGSPVVRNLPVMRDYLVPAVTQVDLLDGGRYVRMKFKKTVNGEEVEHPYYAYWDSTYFWLTYPQDWVAALWPVRETRYFRIHTQPGAEAYLHPVLLDEADRFIERAADSLSLGAAVLREIAEKKIEFFYCTSDSTVLTITGHLTKGTYDLASNDIISATFPHNHEVVHLLVNLKLRSLPLMTQPIVREGIAVHLGGRWGKAPTSLVYLGAFLHKNGLVQVDSLVSMDRFEKQAGADMAYPVAGLFTAFLLDRMGYSRYFDLYLKLSGSSTEMPAMLAPEVKRVVYETVGVSSWDNLMMEFSAYCDRLESERAVFAPGLVERKQGGFDDGGVKVRLYQRWVSLSFPANGPDGPRGNLLFGYDKRLKDVKSVLFEEQYQGGTPFPGYRWGIRYDANEAGLYDYATNQLVGKYIYGITPSAAYRGTAQEVQVRFLIDLSEGLAPTAKDHKLLAD